MNFSEINCPPTDLDGISIGDRVSWRWGSQPRRFGVVRDIMKFGDRTRYGVKVKDYAPIWDVWSSDITKEVG
jgi:hypothetical protein